MSTMQGIPPEQPVPAGPPERRCQRCGTTLAPDQEWCLACGAATDTEIVEARGWRVPIYLGGGLAALAIVGVVLAIIALSSSKEEVAGKPTPTPSAIGTPAVPSPGATAPPLETFTPDPSATPSTEVTPDPTETVEPEPTVDDGNTAQGTGSSFPDWSGTDGYTVIIASKREIADAETIATDAESAGESGVGILNSDEWSSLNQGYYVVFLGEYATEDEAEDRLGEVESSYPDAYIRKVSNS